MKLYLPKCSVRVAIQLLRVLMSALQACKDKHSLRLIGGYGQVMYLTFVHVYSLHAQGLVISCAFALASIWYSSCFCHVKISELSNHQALSSLTAAHG